MLARCALTPNCFSLCASHNVDYCKDIIFTLYIIYLIIYIIYNIHNIYILYFIYYILYHIYIYICICMYNIYIIYIYMYIYIYVYILTYMYIHISYIKYIICDISLIMFRARGFADLLAARCPATATFRAGKPTYVFRYQTGPVTSL